MTETSSSNQSSDARPLGLGAATSIGVGAIVGGGILALAGVAFATTGPSAILAFALNGVIALITALSFAEMSAAFPESGGTYTFAKKVLSVQSAFMIGWVVWFASIVAAVLYALGFAAFAAGVLVQLPVVAEIIPAGTGSGLLTGLAVLATIFYTWSLSRKVAGGGKLINIGKVALFAILIAGGVWALLMHQPHSPKSQLTPFFEYGAIGLIQAMGYTFIALQGFDLIAAAGGEIRNPSRNIPRAMLLSLGIALAIYLPFLFVIAAAGTTPDLGIAAMSAQDPETVVASAASNFLGPFGYWLVTVAAILSMLSALQANLFAASRMARSMAQNRSLPHILEKLHAHSGTPVAATITTALIVILILLFIPDVAAAGAAASLIFLITFAVVNCLTILARRRGGNAPRAFALPFFPVLPIIGAIACAALAVFQGFAVPAAGAIALIWLGIGGVLYVGLFAHRASVVDASAEAFDPDLVRLRGKNPLVLVPIANPASATAMVGIASALAPPRFGRVLLLTVVTPPKDWRSGGSPQQLIDAQKVLGESLHASFADGLHPEALTTVAEHPLQEISRVARLHRCESLLLGLSDLEDHTASAGLVDLMSIVNCDVVILRRPREHLHLNDVRRILVPVGGLGGQDQLRARLLSSLTRTGEREITYLRVVSEHTSPRARKDAERQLMRLALDEAPGNHRTSLAISNSAMNIVLEHAEESDLVILGLQRHSRKRKVFGEFALRIASETDCAILMISRKG